MTNTALGTMPESTVASAALSCKNYNTSVQLCSAAGFALARRSWDLTSCQADCVEICMWLRPCSKLNLVLKQQPPTGRLHWQSPRWDCCRPQPGRGPMIPHRDSARLRFPKLEPSPVRGGATHMVLDAMECEASFCKEDEDPDWELSPWEGLLKAAFQCQSQENVMRLVRKQEASVGTTETHRRVSGGRII